MARGRGRGRGKKRSFGESAGIVESAKNSVVDLTTSTEAAHDNDEQMDESEVSSLTDSSFSTAVTQVIPMPVKTSPSPLTTVTTVEEIKEESVTMADTDHGSDDMNNGEPLAHTENGTTMENSRTDYYVLRNVSPFVTVAATEERKGIMEESEIFAGTDQESDDMYNNGGPLPHTEVVTKMENSPTDYYVGENGTGNELILFQFKQSTSEQLKSHGVLPTTSFNGAVAVAQTSDPEHPGQQAIPDIAKIAIDPEKIEMELIEAACRNMFVWDLEDEDEEMEMELGLSNCREAMITPYQWEKFRKRIDLIGSLYHGKNVLLYTKNGVLHKRSTNKPICCLSSCYSTVGTTENSNTRCSRHHGNTTSFAVLELTFYEEVLGIIVAVGVEHVNIMFSHYSQDLEPERRRRYIEEYRHSGLMEKSRRNLKRNNLKRCAKDLKKNKPVTIRRQWICNTARFAAKKFYIIAMAAILVNKAICGGLVLHGDFRGKHLEFLTTVYPRLEGSFRQDETNKIHAEVNLEQIGTYGTCKPYESLLPPFEFLFDM